MPSSTISTALFAAALLAHRSELSANERSLVISCTPALDLQTPEAAWESILRAFLKAEVAIPYRRRPGPRMMREAMNTAERWSDLGVQVVPVDMIRAPNAAMHDVPPVLFARGDCTMLRRPAAAVLNSRKPLQIGPTDSWLQATKDLVSHARGRDLVIASSYGNIAYAFTTWLAKGSPVLVACESVLPFMKPEEECLDFLTRHEELFDLNATLFLSPLSPGRLPVRPRRLAQRDHLVAALASVVMIAEARRCGNMAAVLDIATRRGIPVVGPMGECRPVARQRGSRPPNASLEEEACEPTVRPPVDLTKYLFHYARSCPGPWPGQTITEYCRSLAEGSPDSRHTAFDTLQRILSERTIRGSNKLTRGASRVVSFTERLPRELNAIIRWRPGLIRWSFELYGVGVPRETLKRLGARPVVYCREGEFSDAGDEDRPFLQVQKPDGTEWSDEKEWRLRGNLDLELLPLEELVIAVPSFQEAEIIEEKFGHRVICLQCSS